MRRCMLALLLLLPIASTPAFELQFRTPCQLHGATDALVQVTITSAQTLCESQACFFNRYDARVDGGARISVASLASLQVGATYTWFLQKRDPSMQAIDVESVAGLQHVGLPAQITFILPFDGAFLRNGKRYYRDVMADCWGDGGDCKVMHALDDPRIRTVAIEYPSFEKALEKCATPSSAA